jgi:serine/threonine-protein kinase
VVAPSEANEFDDMIGQIVAGRYRLERVLGRGGMGVVFEAEHLELGKRVAIKLIRRVFAADERVTSRFAREARAASSVDNPHIVACFDAGTDGDVPYLAMELLRGEDLGTRLRSQGRLPEAATVAVVTQLLQGLAAAHQAGIVHRDLKPDNVFLCDTDTATPHVKIVDFGISKIQKPAEGTQALALTREGVVMGTPFYMSPEQAQALPDIDARADLYSVGAIAFECITGRPPHVGENYEQVILAICTKDPVPLRSLSPDVSARTERVVARALSRDAGGRFESAAARLDAMTSDAEPSSSPDPLADTAFDSEVPEPLRPSRGSAPGAVSTRASRTPWGWGALALVLGVGSTWALLSVVAPAYVHPFASASALPPPPSAVPSTMPKPVASLAAPSASVAPSAVVVTTAPQLPVGRPLQAPSATARPEAGAGLGGNLVLQREP